MTEAEKRAHERQARMSLHKTRLGEPEADFSPVFGAEAVSLVHQLTRISYGLAGYSVSRSPRAQMPCQFVRRQHHG
jgi:hypothetical protein